MHIRSRHTFSLRLIMALLLTIPGCTGSTRQESPHPLQPPDPASMVAVDHPGLDNVVAYTERFFCGALPEGPDGFDTLEKLQVTTVISVDGAVPQLQLARERGIRYIHLPIGYDTIDPETRFALARASMDAARDGNVYVHCHHGRHRCAAAAGMVGVMLGWMDNTEATDRMRVSGIADAYTGLRQMVDSARPASSEALFRVSPEFPEFQEPGDMVETMLQIDDSLSRLQGLAGTGWVVPESDPDISGISEAGRITDLLRLLEDTKDPSLQDQRFLQMLRACGSVANRLELMLETGTQDAGSLDRQLGILEDSCTKCHDRYRNN